MEVKSIYMDLVEGKKNGKGVWKLESEAFKKPIEIKIGYDNHELKQFNDQIEGIKSELKNQKSEDDALKLKSKVLDDTVDILIKRLDGVNRTFVEQSQRIEEQNGEIKQLYKVIADLKTTVETQSGTILHLQEQVSQISKKITKQPTVIHDKCFISGRESSGLGMIDIKDGDYLLIAKYVVGEHNEYVINQDEILFDKIHVEGQHYVPFYKLEGGTELDTPTATIYYDLVFIPM